MAFLNETGLAYFLGKLRTVFCPKKAFSPTPVFTVTLAEDTEATMSAPYTITAQQLGGSYQELYIHMAVKAGTAGAMRIYANWSNNAKDVGQVNNAVYTSTRYVGIRIGNDCGLATMQATAGSGTGTVSEYIGSKANTVTFCGDSTIVSVGLAITTSGVQIPAGTVISVYAAS